MKKKNYQMGDNIHDNVSLNKINWFPGHMNKAIRNIKERLKLVDIILEIRDARSPLITGNKELFQQTRQKSRLIVINKKNLADPITVKLWEEWFTKQGAPFIFINCFDKASLKEIINKSRSVIIDRIKQSNPEKKVTTKQKLKLMVIGLPNTGKSTIINGLANRNATKVADKPGQTQHQLWVKVDKDIEILDTPGIMPPIINKHEHGLWLAALNAIPDRIVSPEISAVYVIEHLIKIKSVPFQQMYKIENIELDLISTLDNIAKTRGYIQKGGVYDYDRVYKAVLGDFRSGKLGLISFGIPPVK